ncbi:AAA family ATPase [Methylobacter sp. Wu8]|uniref:MSHA biogenesis protein MshM n=1 Tax=Methylobacter tundripaludum TaxID=173365 RepID=A0A2S6H5M4_9GAMM|nr:AAA family ATPase [Methylobacter tundripaludum]PPK72764.1 MSHA biogenesis protein MshM [Methylobacter tundripaludum]
MYKTHFGLNAQPFGLTPDTQFFCDLPSHLEALNVLLIALHNGEGFIKITGDVGTGKTMLCRKLLNELPEPFETAYIPNPRLPPVGLLMAIANEMGIEYPRHTGQNGLMNLINDFLINSAANGKKPVLIIDEAQSMSIETLETLRLITNLETEKQKLLQIVLFGQPELDEQLRDKAIRQLRQRITFSYMLKPLTQQNVADYIKHRLRIAGMGSLNIFSRLAIKAMHRYSRGIPRLINILANKAMLAAYGKGLSSIGVKQVYLAALDTEDADTKLSFLDARKRYLLLLLLAIVASLYLWLTSKVIL